MNLVIEVEIPINLKLVTPKLSDGPLLQSSSQL